MKKATALHKNRERLSNKKVTETRDFIAAVRLKDSRGFGFVLFLLLQYT